MGLKYLIFRVLCKMAPCFLQKTIFSQGGGEGPSGLKVKEGQIVLGVGALGAPIIAFVVKTTESPIKNSNARHFVPVPLDAKSCYFDFFNVWMGTPEQLKGKNKPFLKKWPFLKNWLVRAPQDAQSDICVTPVGGRGSAF